MVKILKILLLLAVILMGIYAYALYQELPQEKKEFSLTIKESLPKALNTSSEVIQFVPKMRFAKNNLSYYFQEECSEKQRVNMKQAFSLLTQKTEIIFFHEDQAIGKQADIIIKCSEETRELDQDRDIRTFIAGEGGPTKFISMDPYSLIIQGEIQLYSQKYSKKCDSPLVELHELLHVFGYDHIDDEESILYPYLSCDQELKENIISDLTSSYKEPAKAEVFIDNVTASKSGRYLNFYVEIKNTGLLSSENIVLELYAEERKVREFGIETLIPGSSRTLELSNFQLPSSKINSITFKVLTPINEYSKENNIVKLEIKE